MSSYHQLLYHIIFRTKNSCDSLSQYHIKSLFAYIHGICKHKECYLFRINGTENHIHMLCDIHPSIAIADFMRDMKSSTSIWMKKSGLFPQFDGWADGYAALTYGWRDKDMIINYIKGQQEHHRKITFEEELRKVLQEQGVEINEAYFP